MNTLQNYILESLLDDDDVVIQRGHERSNHDTLIKELPILHSRQILACINTDMQRGDWTEDGIQLPILQNNELRFWSKKDTSLSSSIRSTKFNELCNVLKKYNIDKISTSAAVLTGTEFDFSEFPELSTRLLVINSPGLGTLKICNLIVSTDKNIPENTLLFQNILSTPRASRTRTDERINIYGYSVDLQNCNLDTKYVNLQGIRNGVSFKNVRSTAETLAIHDTFILDADYCKFCDKLGTLFDLDYTFNYKDTRKGEVVTFKSKLFKKLLAWFKNKKYVSAGEVPYKFNSIKFTDILDISGFTNPEFRLYIYNNDMSIVVTKNLKIAKEYRTRDPYHWFSSVDVPRTIDGYYVVITRDPR